MLLRRITKHVKDQNWFAVFLDFVIVVVGILIAFQITNWSNDRADHSRKQEYLLRLQSDFESIQTRLLHTVGEFDKSLDAIVETRSFLKNHDELTGDEEEQFLSLLNKIDALSNPAWRSATYLEMQSAGVLDLIQTPELKESLVQYDQTTEIAQEVFELLIVQSAYVNPILTAVIEYDVNVETTMGGPPLHAVSFDFERMKQGSEFKSALSELARSQSNNRILQANQLNEANSVLKALSEERE